jgi:hypothetical protein
MGPSDPQKLLRSIREHLDWLQHRLVWQMHNPRPQITAEGSADSPVHYWGRAPCHPGPLDQQCQGKAREIAKDSSHLSHRLFTLLTSGRRYQSIGSRTNRFRDIFYPKAKTLLNSHKTAK